MVINNDDREIRVLNTSHGIDTGEGVACVIPVEQHNGDAVIRVWHFRKISLPDLITLFAL